MFKKASLQALGRDQKKVKVEVKLWHLADGNDMTLESFPILIAFSLRTGPRVVE